MGKSRHRVPNVFLVGAAKSGTTSLYQIFQSHSDQMFAPAVKETNYFSHPEVLSALNGPQDNTNGASRGARSEDDYQAFYQGWDSQPYAVDCSPSYLYYPAAAGRIHEAAPDAKVIMILRNPWQAAFSMYAMMHRLGREPETNFRKAYLLSAERRRAGWEHAWDYSGLFRYAAQVARYKALFPERSLKIMLYDQLDERPAEFAQSLSSFLGVELSGTEFETTVANAAPTKLQLMQAPRGGAERAPAATLARYMPAGLKAVAKQFLSKRVGLKLRPADRTFLKDDYRNDIDDLAQLLGLNLDHWLDD